MKVGTLLEYYIASIVRKYFSDSMPLNLTKWIKQANSLHDIYTTKAHLRNDNMHRTKGNLFHNVIIPNLSKIHT